MSTKVDGIRKDLQPAGGNICVMFPVDHDSNYNNYRVQTIAATGAFRFTFCAPPDFSSLVSLELIFAPSVGAAGAGKDIDLYSDYGGPNESTVQHSQADTTSAYDLGTADTWRTLNIAPLFSNLSAQDRCGLFLDHKGIGGACYYVGVKMVYKTV